MFQCAEKTTIHFQFLGFTEIVFHTSLIGFGSSGGGHYIYSKYIMDSVECGTIHKKKSDDTLRYIEYDRFRKQ